MTVAFALALASPNRGNQALQRGPVDKILHWRPRSAEMDSIVEMLYTFFVGLACYDSTWGMLLCAEWGVRSGGPPAKVYSHFIGNLHTSVPDKKHPGRRKTCILRCCETYRLRHSVIGSSSHGGHKHSTIGRLQSMWSNRCRCATGISEQPSWDPFYLIERTVQALFLAVACYLYLTRGVAHATCFLWFYALFWYRVQKHGGVLTFATTSMLQKVVEQGSSSATVV